MPSCSARCGEQDAAKITGLGFAEPQALDDRQELPICTIRCANLRTFRFAMQHWRIHLKIIDSLHPDKTNLISEFQLSRVNKERNVVKFVHFKIHGILSELEFFASN